MALYDALTTLLRPSLAAYAGYVTPLSPYLTAARPYALRLAAAYASHVHPAVALILTTLLAGLSRLIAAILPPAASLLAALLSAPAPVALATAVALLLGALYVYVRVTTLLRRAVFAVLGWLVSLALMGAVAALGLYVVKNGPEDVLRGVGAVAGWVVETWSAVSQEGERRGEEWRGRARLESEGQRIVREYARWTEGRAW